MSFASIDLKTSASLQKLDEILKKIENYKPAASGNNNKAAAKSDKPQANGAAAKQEKGKPQKVTNAAAAAKAAVPAPQQGARAPASRSAAAPAGANITDLSWIPELPPGHSAFSWSEDVNPADAGAVAATPTTATGTIAPPTKTKAEQKPKVEAKPKEEAKKEDNKGKDKQQKQQQPQQQKAKDKKPEPAAAAPAPESNQPAFTRLELRVGKIISAAKHPNADKMYVEQIDLGEGQPRQICSGLVGRVAIEDLPNALCVVVANLKPADLRGQKSEGMILAASSADDTKASLVLAPAGSKIGERVFLQTDGDNEKKLNPDPAGSIDVRKAGNAWALVAPDLKTDATGRVTFKGTALVSSQGPVTSQLTDCKVK